MRRLWNRTLFTDTVIALVLGFATAITTLPAADGEPGEGLLDTTGFAVIGATAMCLSFRRVWPLFTLAAVFAGTSAYALPIGPPTAFTGSDSIPEHWGRVGVRGLQVPTTRLPRRRHL